MKGVIRREYFLSKETAVIMAVLSLLALLLGAGGDGLAYFHDETPYYLVIWFWLLPYPLMPTLKGWYVGIVHSIYPSCQVVVITALWPSDMILPAVDKPVHLLGFQVPGVWMPFLVHVPYWLAVSYGLSALVHRYREGIRSFLAGMVEEMRRLHGYEGRSGVCPSRTEYLQED